MVLFRTTIRLAAAAALAGAALVAVPSPAHACSCASTPLHQYADNVTVAFAGRQVARIEPDPVMSTADDVTLILEVDRVYKGRAGPLISVTTNFSGVSCGIDFSGEGLVAVAAFGPYDDLVVGLCGSQHAVNDFQIVFGPGYPPGSAPPSSDMPAAATPTTIAATTTTGSAPPSSDMPAAATPTTIAATTTTGSAPPSSGMPAAAVALLVWAGGFFLICGAAAAYHLRRRRSGGV